MLLHIRELTKAAGWSPSTGLTTHNWHTAIYVHDCHVASLARDLSFLWSRSSARKGRANGSDVGTRAEPTRLGSALQRRVRRSIDAARGVGWGGASPEVQARRYYVHQTPRALELGGTCPGSATLRTWGGAVRNLLGYWVNDDWFAAAYGNCLSIGRTCVREIN